MKEYRLKAGANRLEKVDIEELALARNLNESARIRLKYLAEDAAYVDGEINFMRDEETGLTYLVSRDGHYTNGYIDESDIVIQYYRDHELVTPTIRRKHFDSKAEYLGAVKKTFDEYAEKLHVSDPEAEARESKKAYLNSELPPVTEYRISNGGSPLTPVSKEEFMAHFGTSLKATGENACIVLDLLGLRIMKHQNHEFWFLVNRQGRYVEFQVSSVGFHIGSGEGRIVVEFVSSEGFRETLRRTFDNHAAQGVVTHTIPEAAPVAPSTPRTKGVKAIRTDSNEEPLVPFSDEEFINLLSPDNAEIARNVINELKGVGLKLFREQHGPLSTYFVDRKGRYLGFMVSNAGIHVIRRTEPNNLVQFGGYAGKSLMDWIRQEFNQYSCQGIATMILPDSSQVEQPESDLKGWYVNDEGKWVHNRYPSHGTVKRPGLEMEYQEAYNNGILTIDRKPTTLSFGEMLDLQERLGKVIAQCQQENQKLWKDWLNIQTAQETERLGHVGSAYDLYE